jgi:hypothetical protein
MKKGFVARGGLSVRFIRDVSKLLHRPRKCQSSLLEHLFALRAASDD